LLCELSLFVLAVTSRKIDPRSDARASDIKAGDRPPYGQKAQTTASTRKGVGAFFFTY
jgi:hypothetical protein